MAMLSTPGITPGTPLRLRAAAPERGLGGNFGSPSCRPILFGRGGRFKGLWEDLATCRRVEAWCDNVERHRSGFTDPNKPTREEMKRERTPCPWLDELGHAQMQTLDREWCPVEDITGPPVLIGGQFEVSGSSELTDDNVPEEGIVARPSELQKYLEEFTERLERWMEQLVGEVRTVAAAQANPTGPPREPSVYGSSNGGGSQGPNLWVHTPARKEGDGGSVRRPFESGPTAIMDNHDNGHLSLGFPPLVPAVLWGTYPSNIPSRSA
ncbi:hypothetical protein TWF506_009390 [Arthrobotrys conoides]|uniref:Uncharacterized protein n=1 Tax=Arthrobotrys conoides TaxID=74498 RepID=A0AAN8NV26_9PEZI